MMLKILLMIGFVVDEGLVVMLMNGKETDSYKVP